ncbi:MAG: hypothetical protein JWP55_4737, partial [Mycobacterium sp.]|nr:hypothetical protein [Mycobacterium sp.]
PQERHAQTVADSHQMQFAADPTILRKLALRKLGWLRGSDPGHGCVC